jgi:hypothetical protein
MLFDLRGRGRRRTIQMIYVFLAVLMGGGLVFFGIGGNTSGGLLDAFKNGGGGGNAGKAFEQRIKTAERRVRINPKDEAGWAQLARLRFQLAGTGSNYNQATSSFTDSGKQALAGVETAWDRYMALNPKKPDDSLASQMVQAFGPSGLNKLNKAVEAMQVVVTSRPDNSNLFAQLAVLAYSAGETRQGDLASQKAVSLAPKAQRSALKQQLASAKQQATGAGSQSAAQGAGTPSG